MLNWTLNYKASFLPHFFSDLCWYPGTSSIMGNCCCCNWCPCPPYTGDYRKKKIVLSIYWCISKHYAGVEVYANMLFCVKSFVQFAEVKSVFDRLISPSKALDCLIFLLVKGEIVPAHSWSFDFRSSEVTLIPWLALDCLILFWSRSQMLLH